MRPEPSAQVVTWVAQQPGTELFTTLKTEPEFFYGIELLGRGKRREGLLAAAEGMFSEDLVGRVFVFDSDAARVFAKIGAARRALGRPISHGDAQFEELSLRPAMLAISKIAELKLLTLGIVNDPY
jgi:predicted nucleic acid-binding protein